MVSPTTADLPEEMLAQMKASGVTEDMINARAKLQKKEDRLGFAKMVLLQLLRVPMKNVDPNDPVFVTRLSTTAVAFTDALEKAADKMWTD